MQEDSLCGCLLQELFFTNGLSQIYLGSKGLFIHEPRCKYRVHELACIKIAKGMKCCNSTLPVQ